MTVSAHELTTDIKELPLVEIEGSAVDFDSGDEFSALVAEQVPNGERVTRSWHLGGQGEEGSVTVPDSIGTEYAIGVVTYSEDGEARGTQIIMLSEVIDKKVQTIGRNPKADMVLTNPGVSGVHMRISHPEGGSHRLESSSTNPVFVFEVARNPEAVISGELGHAAFDAVGVSEPGSSDSSLETTEVAEINTAPSALERLLKEMPILRDNPHLQQRLDVITAARSREENPNQQRHGVHPHDYTDRLIRELVDEMGAIQKPGSLSEDREGRLRRYLLNV